MKDNLFDRRISLLDVVKLFLLVASFFSTLHIISLITPPGPFAFVRIGSFLIVVEGSLLAFERAVLNAKNEIQETLATVGYFWSLAVIAIFMVVSGFLEFSGPDLLSTVLGEWLGIRWTVKEVVVIFALLTVSLWIVGLATIALFFALADPDKQTKMQRKKIEGKMQKERNLAFGKAMDIARGEIAIQSALLAVEHDYGVDLSVGQLVQMKQNVESSLRAHYQQPAPSSPALSPSVPVMRPTHPVPLPPVPAPALALGGNGNGNGQHPTK